MPTHLRIDELFFGVLLGYLYSFHRERVDNLMRPTSNRLLIGLATIVLLSTSFIFPGTSRFYLVFGPTFLYLGFGGLLLLSLYVRGVLPPRFAGPSGKIGYGGGVRRPLFLFDLPVARSVRTLHDPRAQAVFSHSTRRVPVLRMVFLRVRGIRYRDGPADRVPVLRLRDRMFPALQQPPARPAPAFASATSPGGDFYVCSVISGAEIASRGLHETGCHGFDRHIQPRALH